MGLGHDGAAARVGETDPSFAITHQLGLDMAPDADETCKHEQDDS